MPGTARAGLAMAVTTPPASPAIWTETGGADRFRVARLCWRYLRNQGFSVRSFRSFHPGLIRLATELNQTEWPGRIRRHVRGRDVLDLGCGHTLYGVGFLIYGASSYLGIDPKLELDEPRLRRRGRFRSQPADSDWTLRRIETAIPQLAYRKVSLAGLAPEERFDLISMHNVTEHLEEIETVFADARKRLRPPGKIIFRHHNFAAWNGHHRAPRTVAEIDPQSEAQKPFLDWAHLTHPAAQSAVAGHLNRIRLRELRSLTEKFFRIKSWREIPSSAALGAERLTGEIAAKLPDYTAAELLTQAVICIAEV